MSARPVGSVRIAVILASVRPERFGPVVGRWFLGRAEARDDMDIDVLDLADFDLPVTLDGGKDAPELLRRIDAADGFVVVTPEYNHGYPGYLKIAIDSAREEWHRKPVAFVSYGGMAGGQRSVEQLRAVFAELQAPTLRETVSFTWCEEQFDQNGELHESERADSGADTLLGALHWWATSLRAARNEVPA